MPLSYAKNDERSGPFFVLTVRTWSDSGKGQRGFRLTDSRRAPPHTVFSVVEDHSGLEAGGEKEDPDPHRGPRRITADRVLDSSQ